MESIESLTWELASHSSGGGRAKPWKVALGRLSVLGNALPSHFGPHGATELYAVASSLTHLEFTTIVGLREAPCFLGPVGQPSLCDALGKAVRCRIICRSCCCRGPMRSLRPGKH